MPPSPPGETATLPRPAALPAPAPGTVVGGRYRLLGAIGAGGMGAVHLAVDTGPLGRSCAVKFLAGSSPAARARFLEEARIMASLRHPNIVPVTDYGIDEASGLAYYAMDEFLPSPAETAALCRDVLRCPPPAPRPGRAPLTLARLLEGGKTLPEETVLSLARQLLAAVEAAHALSPPVVHRDIKPSNILFSPDGRALLADFGIAKRLVPSGEGPTRPGEAPGTPSHAAPEQLAGGPATPATDYHALGLVLFRALSGGTPGASAALPADIAPEVSRVWRELLPRLLARDPDRRLARASAVRDFLDRIARDIAARKRLRALRRAAIPAAAATVLLLAAASAVLLGRRPSAPDAPAAPGAGAALSAGRRARADGETSARTWVRRYAEALRSLLDRAEEPVPGADAPLRVGEGRVLLSGDLPRNGAPAVLLDGGTLLVSPSRSALREIVSQCARFLETAPGDAPLPAFLPALSRETVSAPLLVGAAGGGVDALDTALGIDFPASLPRAARSREWRDEADCDLLFTGPVRPADGLGTAVLRIGGRTPAVTFTALPADGSVQLVRLPGAGG